MRPHHRKVCARVRARAFWRAVLAQCGWRAVLAQRGWRGESLPLRDHFKQAFEAWSSFTVYVRPPPLPPPPSPTIAVLPRPPTSSGDPTCSRAWSIMARPAAQRSARASAVSSLPARAWKAQGGKGQRRWRERKWRERRRERDSVSLRERKDCPRVKTRPTGGLTGGWVSRGYDEQGSSARRLLGSRQLRRSTDLLQRLSPAAPPRRRRAASPRPRAWRPPPEAQPPRPWRVGGGASRRRRSVGQIATARESETKEAAGKRVRGGPRGGRLLFARGAGARGAAAVPTFATWGEGLRGAPRSLGRHLAAVEGVKARQQSEGRRHGRRARRRRWICRRHLGAVGAWAASREDVSQRKHV